jgi:hypothetical protein
LTFDGAIITEQGVTFAVAVVRRGLLNSPSEREQSRVYFQGFFGAVPVVLMEQDANGTPTWFGRPDITRFLQSVPVNAIPWKRYTV